MKGMQKISRGSGFKGALAYAFERTEEKDKGLLIGGTMAGTTINQLSKEFGRFRKLREDITKPVWHQSLRLPEGDTLSLDKWNKVGHEYMKQMGFDADKNQYAFILHDDDHIHIIANRIDIEGNIWYGRNENIESTRLIAQIEKQLGLTITKNLDYEQDAQGNWAITPGQFEKEKGLKLSKKELERDKRMEVASFNDNKFYEGSSKVRLSNRINEALEGGTTTAEFIRRMEADNQVKIYATIKQGDMAGFTFTYEDMIFKGSQVGASWKDLTTTKGLNYDRQNDIGELQDPARRASSIKQEARKLEPKARKTTNTNNPNRENNGRFGAIQGGTCDIDRSSESASIYNSREQNTGVIHKRTQSIANPIEQNRESNAESHPQWNRMVSKDNIDTNSSVHELDGVANVPVKSNTTTTAEYNTRLHNAVKTDSRGMEGTRSRSSEEEVNFSSNYDNSEEIHNELTEMLKLNEDNNKPKIITLSNVLSYENMIAIEQHWESIGYSPESVDKEWYMLEHYMKQQGKNESIVQELLGVDMTTLTSANDWYEYKNRLAENSKTPFPEEQNNFNPDPDPYHNYVKEMGAAEAKHNLTKNAKISDFENSR